MIRALWFVIRTALLVAAAVWVADRPGTVEIHWLGYDLYIKQIGYALLGLGAILAVALVMYRVLSSVWRAPHLWRRHKLRRRQQRGYRALTLGLTAVAAGDAKRAGYQAQRLRRFWPHDKALGVLLEAQAARLRRDDGEAARHFEKLMVESDTAFLGLRGLLQSAVENGDMQEAARLANQALKLHPDQPWVLRTAYDLDIRLGRWEAAQRHLKQALAHGAIDAGAAETDRAALLLQEAAERKAAGDDEQALGKLKQAHRHSPAFVPAALDLARHYLERGNAKGAADVIEKTWKEEPHPELVPLWHEAMPKKMAKDSAGRMAWYERLVALRPDSAESQLAAAAAAVENNLWGAARAYLERAETIRPGRRVFKLRARLAEALDRPEEASLMLRRAAEAPPEKVWTDRLTGRVYDRWTPVAAPQGTFNTLVWDYAAPEKGAGFADRSELLIAPPRLTSGAAL